MSATRRPDPLVVLDTRPPADRIGLLDVDLFQQLDADAVTLKAGAKLRAPTRLRLFKAGLIETTKGIFKIDSEACRSIMSRHEDYGNDLPFDYDHAMLGFFKLDPAESGKAAGWFKPEIVDGEVWATNIMWTPKAEAAVLAREYRYLSPAFKADEETSRVLEIVNCALTNMPATKRMEAIMASRGAPPASPSEKDMIPKFILVALGLADDAKEADVLRALSQQLESVKAVIALSGKATIHEAMAILTGWKADAEKLPMLAAKLNAIEEATKLSQVNALVDGGIKTGKIAPALKDWALSLGKNDPKALESFLAAAPAIVATTPTPQPGAGTPGATGGAPVTLSAEDKKLAEMMGVDHKMLAETKAKIPTMQENIPS